MYPGVMPLTRIPGRDEELMLQVANGSAEALRLLHARFARPILRLAAHTLDRAAAEDVVQDVFVAVWRNARRFDPERGSVRAWILQIAHFRLLNELRRRSRQPQVVPDPDGLVLDAVPTGDPGPAEAAADRHRRDVLRSALDQLPPPQRDAVGLAFLDDLTHEEVAAELGLPLGTAKTRIRAGLQKLRAALEGRWAALGALCLLAALGVRWAAERATLARYDRALSMVTSSDSVNVRLAPVRGMPDETHARYRGRPGAAIAVLTCSSFRPAGRGRAYQAWVRHGTTWTSLGTVEPDATGSARLIAESPALRALPDGVEITLEPRAGSTAPTGPVIVAWP